ncbi:MAG: hypothetical protein WC325_12555 [Candidatus Bathyarchaeia archaeon]|jgi:hypothetical protein
MLLCTRQIEIRAINTSKSRLLCFTVLFWDSQNNPLYKSHPFSEQPALLSLGYEESLEPELIEALKKSTFLDVVIVDGKITMIK